jgi:hypothetical protein
MRSDGDAGVGTGLVGQGLTAGTGGEGVGGSVLDWNLSQSSKWDSDGTRQLKILASGREVSLGVQTGNIEQSRCLYCN